MDYTWKKSQRRSNKKIVVGHFLLLGKKLHLKYIYFYSLIKKIETHWERLNYKMPLLKSVLIILVIGNCLFPLLVPNWKTKNRKHVGRQKGKDELKGISLIKQIRPLGLRNIWSFLSIFWVLGPKETKIRAQNKSG